MVDQVLVFISHTQSMRSNPPGQSFVAGAEEAVNSVDGAKAFHMAFFPAADEAPDAYSIRQLERADIFLAVVGFDVGSLVPGDARSYTELEFDSATRLRRERLLFVLAASHAHLEGVDPARVTPQQRRFRRKLENSGATVAYFTDVGDLKYKVRQAVEQSVQRRAAPRPAQPRPTAPRVQPGPPSGRALGSALSVLGLLAVLAVAAVALFGWTAVRGSFPPWQPQEECADVTVSVASSVPATFGSADSGATLDLVVTNERESSVSLPAARSATARGADGRQYAPSDALADQSWFFDVTVQPRSQARLQLGLSNPSGGSDQVTVSIPGVRGGGLPITRCTLTTPTTAVDFAARG